MMLISAVPVLALLPALPHQLCELLGGRGGDAPSRQPLHLSHRWGARFRSSQRAACRSSETAAGSAAAMFTSVVGGVMNVALDFAFVVVVPGRIRRRAHGGHLAGHRLASMPGLLPEKRTASAALPAPRRENLAAHPQAGACAFQPDHPARGDRRRHQRTRAPTEAGGHRRVRRHRYIANVIRFSSKRRRRQPAAHQQALRRGQTRHVRRLRNANPSITISIGALGLFATYLLLTRSPRLRRIARKPPR